MLKLPKFIMGFLLTLSAFGASTIYASADTLPNVRVGAAGVIAPANAATRHKVINSLQKRLPPFNVPPMPPLDMPGWTAVTHDGASFAPYLIKVDHGFGLLVRGSDNSWYGADIDLSNLEVLPSNAWNAFPLTGAQYCFQDNRSAKHDGAVCSSINGGVNVLTAIFAEAGEDETKTVGTGVWDYDYFANLPANGSPATLAITDNTKVRLLAWDGATGMGTTVIVPEGKSTAAPPWTKLAFWAYGRPACDGYGDCVSADGGGDSLSFYHIKLEGDGKPGPTLTLPPVPGGGGMRKGEYAIAWLGSSIDVFSRSKDGTLYVSASKNAGASFGPWKSMGATVAEGAAPSCMFWDSVPTCAILGTDHRIYVHFEGKSGNGL